MSRRIGYLELCILFLCMLIGVGNGLWAAEGPIEISEMPNLTSTNNQGYASYNFNAKNNTNRKLTFQARVEYDNRYSSNSHIVATKDIELQPNESKNDVILLPNTVLPGRIFVKIVFLYNDRVIKHKTLSEQYGGVTSDHINILVDKRINSADFNKMYNDRAKGKLHAASYFASNEDMLNRNWTAYAQFSGILYLAESIDALPAPVGEAFFDYVRAGGNLVVIGSMAQIPRDARLLKNTHPSYIINRYSLGFGRLTFVEGDYFQRINSKSNERRHISTVRVKDDPFNVTDEVFQSYRIFNTRVNVSNEFEKAYKVMSSQNVIAILVLVFFFLIGPINALYLHKKNKKILIFISVPAISALCCLMVFGYYLIFEYGRLEIYRRSLTYLDQNTNTASTFGNAVILSGRTRNNSLVFPLNSLVYTKTFGAYFSSQSSLEKEITFDANQNFTKNWIRPKSPFCYAINSVTRERARIEFEKYNLSSKGPSLLNALGADIDSIYIRTKAGDEIYTASNVAAGKEVVPTLYKSISSNKSPSYFLNYPYYLSNGNRDDSLDFSNITYARYIDSFLDKGEYVAILKSDPFMKQSFDDSAKIHELGTVVIGKMK